MSRGPFCRACLTLFAALAGSPEAVAQSSVGFRIVDHEAAVTSARGRALITRMGDDGPEYVGALTIAAGTTASTLDLPPGTYDLDVALHGRVSHVGEFDVEKDGPETLTHDVVEPSVGVLVTGTVEQSPGKPVPAGTRFVLDIEREGAPFAGRDWHSVEVEVMCDEKGGFAYGLPAPSGDVSGLRESQTFCSVRVLSLEGGDPDTDEASLRGFRSLHAGSTWDMGIIRTSSLGEREGLTVALRDGAERAILGIPLEVEATPVGRASCTWIWSTDQLDQPSVVLQDFPVAEKVSVAVKWGARFWTAEVSSLRRKASWTPPPLVRVIGSVAVPNKHMRNAPLRVILSSGEGLHRIRYSERVEDGTTRFVIPDVLPGTYEVIIENPWDDASHAGTIVVEPGRTEQNVGAVSLEGWRTLLLYEPEFANAARNVAPGRRRGGYTTVTWMKDGRPTRTRPDVVQLVDEVIPGHFRLSLPPTLDLDRWGVIIRFAGQAFQHPRLSDLAGKSPKVVVVIDRYRKHLAHSWLKTVLVLRREGMPWSDGIRRDLSPADIAAGKDPELVSFPGEWLIGLELTHTGHGGMALVELGTFDVAPNGADRFVPGPRKLGEVIEAVAILEE